MYFGMYIVQSWNVKLYDLTLFIIQMTLLCDILFMMRLCMHILEILVWKSHQLDSRSILWGECIDSIYVMNISWVKSQNPIGHNFGWLYAPFFLSIHQVHFSFLLCFALSQKRKHFLSCWSSPVSVTFLKRKLQYKSCERNWGTSKSFFPFIAKET